VSLQAPKNVVPSGDEPPHSNPAGHSGQHGAGGGGSGGGAMGQGNNEEGKTIEKENNTRNPLDQGVHVAAGKVDEHTGVPGFGLWTRGGDKTDKEVLLKKGLGAYDSARGANGSTAGEGDSNKLDVPHSQGEGIERSRQRGSTISRRARSTTMVGSDDASSEAASAAGEKKGRGRSSTLAGGKDEGKGGKEDKGAAEGHDHDEAFPEDERKQMEALLEEVTGQLGAPLFCLSPSTLSKY